MVTTEDRTFSPAPELRSWVSEIRVLRLTDAPPRTMTRLPSGTTSLVLCSLHEESATLVGVGPNTRAFYKRPDAVPFYTRFAFRPGGARALLGVAVHELTNRAVSLEDLWGERGADLRRKLRRVEGEVGPTVHALEAALLERLERRPTDAARADLLRRAVDALDASDADHDEPYIHGLARKLRVSERQLRQLFRDDIGISPKRYARIARIRRAVAKAGTTGWARLAVETGFYDQAHLASEFRELLGVTPSAYLAGAFPLEPCSTAC